jgi:hypothetical protein
MKTCPYCKFEIPMDAQVCGYCRKDQPRASVPAPPKQIQRTDDIKWGHLIISGTIFVVLLAIAIVRFGESDRESIRKYETDRQHKIEQQSWAEAANTISRGMVRYADLLDGKIKISAADQRKEAEALRQLAALALKQSGTVQASGHVDSTSISWDQLSAMLTSDAQVMESIFAGMTIGQRTSSAELHRQVAAVFRKQVGEGLRISSSQVPDPYVPSRSLRSDPKEPISASPSVDFIQETSDLPSSAQRALDKIYREDPARARELSRQAHEVGVQHLPDQ